MLSIIHFTEWNNSKKTYNVPFQLYHNFYTLARTSMYSC